MTKDELLTAINKLTDEYNKTCRSLRKQFALENNPVKVGDVVSYSKYPKATIRVTEIKVANYSAIGFPECVYCGNVIDPKTGEESDKTEMELYQSKIDKINGEEYKYRVI